MIKLNILIMVHYCIVELYVVQYSVTHWTFNRTFSYWTTGLVSCFVLIWINLERITIYIVGCQGVAQLGCLVLGAD